MFALVVRQRKAQRKSAGRGSPKNASIAPENVAELWAVPASARRLFGPATDQRARPANEPATEKSSEYSSRPGESGSRSAAGPPARRGAAGRSRAGAALWPRRRVWGIYESSTWTVAEAP